MTEKRPFSVRLSDTEAEWVRSRGGLAAVVRAAMSRSPGIGTPLVEVFAEETKIRPALSASSAHTDHEPRPVRCRHPIARRIGTACGVCGAGLK
jgi:hypothetical protein